MAGRPTSYDLKLASEICELVQDGLNIKAALETNDKYPSFPTWCKWKRENPELLNLYVNSIQDKAEDVDYKIDNTIKELKEGSIDASTANVIIQSYKWKAAKYYPKMFGDKSEVEHSGEIKQTEPNINLIVDGKSFNMKEESKE